MRFLVLTFLLVSGLCFGQDNNNNNTNINNNTNVNGDGNTIEGGYQDVDNNNGYSSEVIDKACFAECCWDLEDEEDFVALCKHKCKKPKPQPPQPPCDDDKDDCEKNTNKNTNKNENRNLNYNGEEEDDM